jgi:hypothetical protein
MGRFARMEAWALALSALAAAHLAARVLPRLGEILGALRR